MFVKRIREEVEILSQHMKQEKVDLDFLLNHLNDLLVMAQSAARGEIEGSSSLEDITMVQDYWAKHNHSFGNLKNSLETIAPFPTPDQAETGVRVARQYLNSEVTE